MRSIIIDALVKLSYGCFIGANDYITGSILRKRKHRNYGFLQLYILFTLNENHYGKICNH